MRKNKFKDTNPKTSQQDSTKVENKNKPKTENANNASSFAGSSNIFLQYYSKYPHLFWIAVITILTFIAYIPIFKADFVNWDDDRYVTLNKNIQELSLKNVTGFFSNYYFVLYLPLPLLSYAIEYHFSGLNPFVFHFNNVLLHLINTALVFIFIYNLVKTTRGKRYLEIAIVTSLLFGVHTFHVQSVAWISERKDLLYTAFYLLALIFYIKYLKSNQMKHYLITIFIFLLSLLSKGQAVTLSVILLVLDYYYDRNLFSKKVIIEKIPFFTLSLIFGIVNLMAYATQEPFAESTAQLLKTESRTFLENVLYSCYGYMAFIAKTVIPYNLASIYPYPAKVGGSLAFYFWLMPIPVAAITACIFYFFKKSKEIVFGILFYSISITLILQIIADQPFIIMDHYSYVSSIGILFLFGFGMTKAIDYKNSLKIPIYIVFTVYSLFLMFATMQRLEVWKNSETLWIDLSEKYPTITIAHYNRGNYVQEKADKKAADNQQEAVELYKQAIEHYTNTLRLDSVHVGAYSNRGITRAKIGDANGALADFNRVVKLDSTYSNVYSNRGNARSMVGDMVGAIQDYSKAIAGKPDYLDAYINRARAKSNTGDFAGALLDYEQVLRLNPNNANVYINQCFIYLNLNKYDEVLSIAKKAIALDANSYAIYYYRGVAKEKKGDQQGAQADYKTAMRLNPNMIKNFLDNGANFERANNATAAMAEYEKAIQLAPNNTDAYISKGVLKGRLGNMKGAIEEFDKALQIDPKSANAYTNRAFAKDLSGNTAGALEDYSSALKLDPNMSTAYYNRGILRNKQKDYKNAIIDFDMAIKIRQDFAEAYYNRGSSQIGLNQKDAACADFNKALQLGMQGAQTQIKQYCK